MFVIFAVVCGYRWGKGGSGNGAGDDDRGDGRKSVCTDAGKAKMVTAGGASARVQ